jgi:DNA-binding IclR family transcriptional regulator
LTTPLAKYSHKREKRIGEFKDTAERRLFALKVLGLRMTGLKQSEIAQQLGCHRSTVYKLLDYAQKAGLIAAYEDQILQALVPKAIGAIEKALDEGNFDVAQKMLAGMGIYKRPAERRDSAAEGAEMSVETYLLRKQQIAAAQTESPPALDARIVEDIPLELPEAALSVAGEA